MSNIHKNNAVNNFLVKLIGYPATVLHGDPAVFDRWLWLKKNLRPGPRRTLDAGCGSGAFTMYAAKIGNQAIGISFDERNNQVATERAQILRIPNVDFINGDLRELDKTAKILGKFDQIICLETIEHILDDKKLIKDFASLLNPDGRLLLTTPYKYYRHLYGDDKPESAYAEGGHVRCGYTHQEMTNLLEKFGFKIQKIGYLTGYLSQQIINLQRILSQIDWRLAWLVILPLRLLQFLDPLFAKIINYPFLCISVVAIKQ